MKAHILLGASVLLAALAHCPNSSAATSSPTTEPLVYQSNLVYVGSFRLPKGTSTQTSFSYAGQGLTYDATDNSLFLTGHRWYQYTAEISIPTPSTASSVSNLPVARLMQPLTDALDGRLSQIDPTDPNVKEIGGYLVYNSQLIVSALSYYDGDGTQSTSHFIRSTNLSSSQLKGPFRVGTQYPGFVSGYMALIPPEWVSLFKMPAITGDCCLPIVSQQSNGPSVSAFNPTDLGTQTPVPAIPLVGYPNSNPLGTWNTENDLFNGSTKITGVTFPNGTRSILFFGSQGIGSYCYGVGTKTSPPPTNYCYDPADTSKGNHAYPYIYQVWAYDANDLLKVANGEEPEYAVKPYSVWNLKLPFTNSGARNLIDGATYDPTTNEIFVTQDCIDTNCTPIIDVFKISNLSLTTSNGAAPSPPTSVVAN